MRRRSSVAALVMVFCFAAPGLAAAAPATPSADPFYSPSGSLTGVAPGTVLRSRNVTVNGSGVPTTFRGTQVLYRTTNQLGQPDATVATIIQPAARVGAAKLLSYQTFYDGVASTCRPSYTLQDGSGSPAAWRRRLMAPYLAAGLHGRHLRLRGPDRRLRRRAGSQARARSTRSAPPSISSAWRLRARSG